MKISRKFFFSLVIGRVMLATLPACSAQSSSGNLHLKMASMDQMPAEVHSAPATVQEAYEFNVANPDVMEDIPCYCGCGNIGHTSN